MNNWEISNIFLYVVQLKLEIGSTRWAKKKIFFLVLKVLKVK